VLLKMLFQKAKIMRPINLIVPIFCALLLSMLAAACAPAPTLAPTVAPPSPTPLPLPTAAPALAASATPAPSTTVGSPLTFSGQILPLLQSKCATCHGPDIKYGGFDVSTYSSVMTGGNDGPMIVAGNVSGSPLVAKILRMQEKPMPPSEPLANDEIMVILNWISAGAPEN
jgi:mono/diheme cytochrome c family protein